MARTTHTQKELQFKRRRNAQTNYRKRLALVKSKLERIVVRKTNRRITGQISAYAEVGDVTKGSVDSRELLKFGWPSRSNKTTAYLTGLLLAKKTKASKNEYILDIGLSTPVKASIPFAFAQGCIDGGMKIRSGAKLDEKVYDSSLTAKYAADLKKDAAKYNLQFGAYIKAKSEPENLPKLFKEVKEKIMNGA